MIGKEQALEPDENQVHNPVLPLTWGRGRSQASGPPPHSPELPDTPSPGGCEGHVGTVGKSHATNIGSSCFSPTSFCHVAQAGLRLTDAQSLSPKAEITVCNTTPGKRLFSVHIQGMKVGAVAVLSRLTDR